MNQEFAIILEDIQNKDPRYKEDSYLLVMESLSYVQRRSKTPKHVTGEEILQGVRSILLHRYGPFAITVLKHWGINSTEDFGNVVFNLVENKVLSKTEDDDISKFRNFYDFEEVFNQGYRKQLLKKISRMR